MPKDYANIYNLSEEEFVLEKKDLWKDAIPGTIDLANNLLKKIEDDEYPYVLSVEASYGMGKTYFFSRFCEHAKDNGYDCIYISAWENDYQPSPFLFLCNKIIRFMKNKDDPVVKSHLVELVSICKDILTELHINASVYNIFHIDIITCCKIIYNRLLNKNNQDAIQEFKKHLTELIVSTKTKPLIIIVDELDRCRPDYALKTLEIIKHFFDVDNLYVILPINKNALEQAVEATYGKINNSENYMRKLITETYIIPNPNKESYRKIVKSFISKEKLKRPIRKKFIETNDNFNGFNTIIESITKYSFDGKLTYREVSKVCNEFICYANKFNKKIMVEYLAYKLCKQYSSNNVHLNVEHPFYTSGYTTKKRQQIMNIEEISKLTYDLHSLMQCNFSEMSYIETVRKWEKSKSDFDTYEAFYKYVDNVLNTKDDVLKCRMYHGGQERFLKFFNELENAKKLALEYQCKYGSTDNDKNEQLYYDSIITNSLCLYEK